MYSLNLAPNFIILPSNKRCYIPTNHLSLLALITPPPLKSDNHFFWQLDQFFSTFGKKFPFEKAKTVRKIFKNLVLDMQHVRLTTQNASLTEQNVSWTAQNVGDTMHNVDRNTLDVCKGPKGGGLRCPPTPIHEKTLVSMNDF